jgi:hypothetical protein
MAVDPRKLEAALNKVKRLVRQHRSQAAAAVLRGTLNYLRELKRPDADEAWIIRNLGRQIGSLRVSWEDDAADDLARALAPLGVVEAKTRRAALLTWKRDVAPAVDQLGLKSANDHMWAPWAKDKTRAQDLWWKSGQDPDKAYNRARAMARSIKSLPKLIRRGRAMVEITPVQTGTPMWEGSRATGDTPLLLAQPFYAKALDMLAEQAATRTAYLDGAPGQKDVVKGALFQLLALLRAQAFLYQTAHWQVHGDHFYGNHLLFERLYEGLGPQIDELAEKMVGYLGPEAVNPEPAAQLMTGWIAKWGHGDDPFFTAFKAEEDCQRVIKGAYDAIEASGLMTLGLDDWLMATASAHEENQYLIQQVSRPEPGEMDKQVVPPVPVLTMASRVADRHLHRSVRSE